MTKLSNIYEFLQSKMECRISYCSLSTETCEISQPIKLDENNNDPFAIFWVNKKNISKTNSLSTGILIAPIDFIRHSMFNGTILACENPRRAFSLILSKFFDKEWRPIPHGVSIPIKSMVPHSTKIGKGTVIEEDVLIGSNSIIGYNNVILRGTIIGDNVKIGSNNTIGAVGFGYEKSEDGKYELIPHVGNVIIENNVEIGNNNCIDRAVLGSTILKENCKIDNLVHIAHGVIIGKNSLIIANAMIAGSAVIGENTWIAPSTSVINGGKVGSNSMTGLGAVVVREIEDNSLAVGVPAKKIKDL